MLATLRQSAPSSRATIIIDADRRVLRVPEPRRVAAQRIAVVFERGALKQWEAAQYLGIGTTQLWKLTQLGKVRRTSYGTYPITELDRHLREEVKC